MHPRPADTLLAAGPIPRPELLVFAWGNPSRGDDALGPIFLERLQALAMPQVECLTDFQLQVEHALDLRGRSRILLVDASVTATGPFTVSALSPARDPSYSSHALSPRALLQAYVDLEGQAPPPTWQLAIRGASFELGEGLSPAGRRHLEQALSWAIPWLQQTIAVS